MATVVIENSISNLEDEVRSLLKNHPVDVCSDADIIALPKADTKPCVYVGRKIANFYKIYKELKKEIPHFVSLDNQNLWKKELQFTIQSIECGTPTLFSFAPVDGHINFEITRLSEKENVKKEIEGAFKEENRISTSLLVRIWGVLEEMIMNALIDAPIASGRADRNLRCTVDVYISKETIEMQVTDYYGLMREKTYFDYASKILNRENILKVIDSKSSGAGLGIMKMHYSSNILSCFVNQGQKTIFQSVIDRKQKPKESTKESRAIHFFHSI